jgi:hypothetical protein
MIVLSNITLVVDFQSTFLRSGNAQVSLALLKRNVQYIRKRMRITVLHFLQRIFTMLQIMQFKVMFL